MISLIQLPSFFYLVGSSVYCYLLQFCIFMENEKIVYNFTTDKCNLDDIQISADALSDTIYLFVSFRLPENSLEAEMLSRDFSSYIRICFYSSSSLHSLRYDGILWHY